MKTKATIVGSGRFAKVLVRLLQPEMEVTVLSRQVTEEIKKDYQEHSFLAPVILTDQLEEAYRGDRAIFYSVPIQSLEQVVKQHLVYLRSDHLIVDVLSVKMHPQQVYQKYLAEKDVPVLLTHPMFGPDSSKNGFSGLPMVLSRELCNEETYQQWKAFFAAKGLRNVELTADEHDRLAANSQGLTHFMGRLLKDFGFDETVIDTTGAKRLHEIVEQTCNDTWELFLGLQNYNPYTKPMRAKLGEVYEKLYNRLLPEKIEAEKTVFGIQGGPGSFNEQALLDYVARHQIADYRIEYLYTTEKVLAELHLGNIDFGQFAIHNSLGGIVGESVEAMSRYNFKIVEEYAILIAHFLMKKRGVEWGQIERIMTHPQVIAQCKGNLAAKYANLQLTSGEGDLVDSATAAKALAEGDLPESTAVMGPEILSKLYNLEVVEGNLQDSSKNFTSFMMVKRPN